MKKYDISFELFKVANPDLTPEEMDFCYENLKYDSIVNILFFKCLDYARKEEMFLNVTDHQHFYIVSVKDYENEYEPHPEFKSIDLKEAIFNTCEYIVK